MSNMQGGTVAGKNGFVLEVSLTNNPITQRFRRKLISSPKMRRTLEVELVFFFIFSQRRLIFVSLLFCFTILGGVKGALCQKNHVLEENWQICFQS